MDLEGGGTVQALLGGLLALHDGDGDLVHEIVNL